jgi:hypothetical protein
VAPPVEPETLSAGSDRARRVLRSARIPLWVMRALSGVDVEDPRLMTAEDLVVRAGLSQPVAPRFRAVGEPSPEALLADAESALRVLRVLATLGVPPAAWNDFLEGLVVSPQGDTTAVEHHPTIVVQHVSGHRFTVSRRNQDRPATR